MPSTAAMRRNRQRSSTSSLSCSGVMETETAVRDPVCGMTVNPATAKHHETHEGHDYYFCSAKCHAKFRENPTQYLAPNAPPEAHQRQAAPAPKPAQGTIYTCPMHPQIRQDHPGNC